LGLRRGDRVAVLAPNSHLLLESHFGVPYAGGVLVALNTRLAVNELAYILEHSGSRFLLCHSTTAELGAQVLASTSAPIRLVVEGREYDDLIDAASPLRASVDDELALLALNYTSGTTGRPKGVMYHHRGAYLQALAMTLHARLTSDSVYLWTLPMFHCNGWCFTWAVTAAGGVHVCMPQADPDLIWALMVEHEVSHLCAAPTVLVGLVQTQAAQPLGERVWAAVGGAPPSPTLLESCAALGLDITHLYGLTETFGPVVICDWRSDWNDLDDVEQAARRARQGVGNTVSCPVRVVGPDGTDVPRDGVALGEVAVRGNNVMLGYYQDADATVAAAPDGWFRTGDLAVLHPDGYLEIRDRAKDVIISGGENISSVEVEQALVTHPAVLEAAVFPVPDDHWGERPAALITLKEGAQTTEQELRDHVRGLLAGFKVPDSISFGALPKTATGKIQKFRLREDAWAGKSRANSPGDPNVTS
ncbi:MAG: AMP-binding protein, partial [Propionibacteriales bacterium]|nr:AMP-binding protein [Propionibacteriales bacterium]